MGRDLRVVGRDLRVELVLLTRETHMLSFASTARGRRGEEWKCQCGVHFTGDGALAKGRRHDAEVVLAALDEAAVTP